MAYEDLYQRKCPICGKPLEYDDIDYGFKGKQDEYTFCYNCKHSFLTEIRFGKVWKIKADEIKENENGEYLIVEGTQKTMYPNGKDINALKG